MKKKLLKVGNYSVAKAHGFVYDGCHKIYVVCSVAEYKEMKSYGYEKLYPMEQLEQIFAESCPLRFISWADLGKSFIVSQCARKVTFTYNTGKSVVRCR